MPDFLDIQEDAECVGSHDVVSDNRGYANLVLLTLLALVYTERD